MRTISNNIKNALANPTTQRKGRIFVNNTYYDVYNVEYYADCYDEGNIIGNAISSQLDFDIPYMYNFNEFKYYDGIWTGNSYEYIDMGTFTVFDEKNEDEFKKHITAFDNLIKFNSTYISQLEYPTTIYDLLVNICQQAGVILNNQSIPNGDFVVEDNQFVNEESLKTILKAICAISGTYAIIKNDNLTLQLKNTTQEEIDKSYHEPVNWKRTTYGINQVILGMQDVEGEYVIKQDDEDIALNGVHKLVINDNPFAYTQEKRQQLIDDLYDQVHLFGYIPYELKGEWLSYLEIGDTITIDDIDTIVLRINGKSPNSINSEMSAPAIIDSSIEYVDNTNSIENILKNIQILVDKANATIQSLITETEEINGSIYELGTTMTQNQNKFQYSITQLTNTVNNNNENLNDKISNINSQLSEGVNTLKNTLVTIDKDGIKVSTDLSKISTEMTNDTFAITDDIGTILAYFGYDESEGQSKSQMDNLTIINYFVAGVHRVETFEDGGEERTGWFYIGGGS